MSEPQRFGVKLFADGADVDSILGLAGNPLIDGFTTNPTLMRKAGVDDYEGFARKVLDHITDRPVCFEVFSDDFGEMRRQAHQIASWGSNVCVKIPVTNTDGVSSAPLVADLAADGLYLNVTALLSLQQVRTITESLAASSRGIVSVFAGRVADTGRDPVPLVAEAVKVLAVNPALELLWASPREILNVRQAESVSCHIITLTSDLLNKLDWLGRDLEAVSLDTVRMFRRDAEASGYLL